MYILKNQKYLLVLLFTFVAFQVTACTRSAVPRRDSSSVGGNLEEQILYYTNKFRQSKGLTPLEMNATINQQAEQHSRDMASGRTGFGHEGFEERVDVVTKKVGRVAAAAENVAYGTLDAEAVVNGWIKSPGHRKNMLGNYNLIGIGAAKKGKITFFTQVFIKK